MLPALNYAALGLETFRDDLLVPAAILAWEPLSIEVAHLDPAKPDLRLSPAEAARLRFRPVELGYRWGPVWSTAWFRLRGKVPASMRGQRLSLRFSSGAEATLWRDGVPFAGFDPYHDLVPIAAKAKAGERIDLLAEAACNLPLGISTFWWEDREHHARWKEAKPGRVESAELVVRDDAAWRFAQAFDFARRLIVALPPESPRAHDLVARLVALKSSMPADAPFGPRRERLPALSRELDSILRGRGGEPATRCTAVGHAHIDTAWLWPIAETRRKCLRTFASVLRLEERFPDFHFLCSQAQQYAWVEEDSPGLFRQIAKRVAEGRWEPGGAMWIEPDCNVPSGESLVRQVIHGTGWWISRFGKRGEQRFLYLPDTFGFPACLPQVARLSGLDTFLTNKMSWCESNRFPHVTFRWKGLDGSELLTHLTPGHNYNSSIEPPDMLYGQKNLLELDARSFTSGHLDAWLQPFGYGDGGGGPTEEQVLRVELAEACEGLPGFSFRRVDEFCGQLHAKRESLRKSGRDVACWDGELYLELHRGTLTTQAWLKRANRVGESLLRDAELLACTAWPGDAKRLEAVRKELDGAWKALLLNQFHDILPGSSIGRVYDDARKDLAVVHETAARMRDESLAAIAARIDTRDEREPMLVHNPGSRDRGGTVELEDGRLASVPPVPALGVRVIDAGRPESPRNPVRIVRGRGGSLTLDNGLVAATIDGRGRLVDLRSHATGENVAADGTDLASLVLYDDRPRRWEAWDLDRDYRDRATPLDAAVRPGVTREDPLRGEIAILREFGADSSILLTFRLDADARRLDLHAVVTWNETQKLLRLLVPTRVRATEAAFGTQFGRITRATHRNTSWEEARFEVPGHAWMDLSQPGLGLAVVDDGKFGRSVEGGTLGLSLLKAPNFPDPTADRGVHAFALGLVPHAGSPHEAGVESEAEALRDPLVVRSLPRRRGTTVPAAPFRVECSPWMRVEIAAYKPAEDARGRRVLRLVETRGGGGEVTVAWSDGHAPREARAVDLLERPLAANDPRGPGTVTDRRGDDGAVETTFRMRPFQIVTLLCETPLPCG